MPSEATGRKRGAGEADFCPPGPNRPGRPRLWKNTRNRNDLVVFFEAHHFHAWVSLPILGTSDIWNLMTQFPPSSASSHSPGTSLTPAISPVLSVRRHALRLPARLRTVFNDWRRFQPVLVTISTSALFRAISMPTTSSPDQADPADSCRSPIALTSSSWNLIDIPRLVTRISSCPVHPDGDCLSSGASRSL